MSTIWKILIDWDRNGNFTGTHDDITSYVLNAKWYLGSSQAYNEVANDSTFDLVLNNSDKRFSPENSSSPLFGKLLPLRPVRITSDDGSTERIHWQGWIQTLIPLTGQYGERHVQISSAGAMQFLKAAESKIALQLDKRTDEVIDTLIGEVVFPPSVVRGAFLDTLGFNQIGTDEGSNDGNAYVLDLNNIRIIDEGSVTLSIAADNWVASGGFADRPKDTFDVYRGIKDMVATEHGKFFFDRQGRAIFWNRQRLLRPFEPAATFDDTMQELQYNFGSTELLKNEIIVTSHPRTISDSAQVLWKLENSVIRVPANDSRSLYVKFEDDSENRIGGQDVTIDDLEFEKGSATASVKASANGADLTFTNAGDTEAIVKAAAVYGRRIVDSGYMEATAKDDTSIVNYGRRALRLNLPSVDSLEQAQYIADFELIRRKDPIGQIQALTSISHGKRGGNQHDQQLARTIGDIIRITETQTGHNKDHVIIGEAHELTENATFFKTTWYLEPITVGKWAFVEDELDDAKVYGDGTEDPEPYEPYEPYIVAY